MTPTDDQIKFVAAQAARSRWGIQSYSWPTWTDFKQIGPNSWELTYNEPDTNTTEDVDVYLVENELHAYAWSSTPVICKL